MNLCFYESLERLPLGIAVMLEFVGPLTVAIAGTRNRLDVVWVLLAAAGIVLLAPDIGDGLDATRRRLRADRRRILGRLHPDRRRGSVAARPALEASRRR